MTTNIRDVIFGPNTNPMQLKRVWNPSSGEFPALPVKGYVYIAADDGDVGSPAVSFSEGDAIIYDNNEWKVLGSSNNGVGGDGVVAEWIADLTGSPTGAPALPAAQLIQAIFLNSPAVEYNAYGTQVQDGQIYYNNGVDTLIPLSGLQEFDYTPTIIQPEASTPASTGGSLVDQTWTADFDGSAGGQVIQYQFLDYTWDYSQSIRVSMEQTETLGAADATHFLLFSSNPATLIADLNDLFAGDPLASGTELITGLFIGNFGGGIQVFNVVVTTAGMTQNSVILPADTVDSAGSIHEGYFSISASGTLKPGGRELSNLQEFADPAAPTTDVSSIVNDAKLVVGTITNGNAVAQTPSFKINFLSGTESGPSTVSGHTAGPFNALGSFIYPEFPTTGLYEASADYTIGGKTVITGDVFAILNDNSTVMPLSSSVTNWLADPTIIISPPIQESAVGGTFNADTGVLTISSTPAQASNAAYTFEGACVKLTVNDIIDSEFSNQITSKTNFDAYNTGTGTSFVSAGCVWAPSTASAQDVFDAVAASISAQESLPINCPWVIYNCHLDQSGIPFGGHNIVTMFAETTHVADEIVTANINLSSLVNSEFVNTVGFDTITSQYGQALISSVTYRDDGINEQQIGGLVLDSEYSLASETVSLFIIAFSGDSIATPVGHNSANQTAEFNFVPVLNPLQLEAGSHADINQQFTQQDFTDAFGTVVALESAVPFPPQLPSHRIIKATSNTAFTPYSGYGVTIREGSVYANDGSALIELSNESIQQELTSSVQSLQQQITDFEIINSGIDWQIAGATQDIWPNTSADFASPDINYWIALQSNTFNAVYGIGGNPQPSDGKMAYIFNPNTVTNVTFSQNAGPHDVYINGKLSGPVTTLPSKKIITVIFSNNRWDILYPVGATDSVSFVDINADNLISFGTSNVTASNTVTVGVSTGPVLDHSINRVTVNAMTHQVTLPPITNDNGLFVVIQNLSEFYDLQVNLYSGFGTIDGGVSGAPVSVPVGKVATFINTSPSTWITNLDASQQPFVIDEDTMVSNLDTKVPTQQSVKSYVDTELINAAYYRFDENASVEIDAGATTFTLSADNWTNKYNKYVTVAENTADCVITLDADGGVPVGYRHEFIKNSTGDLIFQPELIQSRGRINFDFLYSNFALGIPAGLHTLAIDSIQVDGVELLTESIPSQRIDSAINAARDQINNNVTVPNYTATTEFNYSIASNGELYIYAEDGNSDGLAVTYTFTTGAAGITAYPTSGGKQADIISDFTATFIQDTPGYFAKYEHYLSKPGGKVVATKTDVTNQWILEGDLDGDVKLYSWAIDEDTMVSNLDTKVPTQQSVKSYVDNSSLLWVADPIVGTGSPLSADVEINRSYFVNTSGGAFVINLPASAGLVPGDSIKFKDVTGTWNSNNITIAPDSTDNFEGVAAPAGNYLGTTNRECLTVTWSGASQGWVITSLV